MFSADNSKYKSGFNHLLLHVEAVFKVIILVSMLLFTRWIRFIEPYSNVSYRDQHFKLVHNLVYLLLYLYTMLMIYNVNNTIPVRRETGDGGLVTIRPHNLTFELVYRNPRYLAETYAFYRDDTSIYIYISKDILSQNIIYNLK